MIATTEPAADVISDQQPLAVNRRTPNVQALSLATMGNLLQIAVEQRIDPAAMERLVALHERLMKADAEAQFNAAFQRFQSECPPIAHNRKGYKDAYSYADLPQIAETIRPILNECGLSYSFSSPESTDGAIKMVCTVHHVAGHNKSAEYSARIAKGTSMMNSVQESGSTLTYCKRYALCLVLGLTTEATDDDGSSVPRPSPQPAVNRDAPRVAPRAERQQQPKNPIVAPLNALYERWASSYQPEGDVAQKRATFASWAAQKLQTDKDMSKTSAWTQDAIEVCSQAIK